MSPIEQVIKNKKTTINPIWIMRQAGRYLPEFREIRKANPNFINLCLNENLSSEITLQPIKRYDFDAAIIFSDILMLPYGIGQKVEFVKGIRKKNGFSIEGSKYSGLVEGNPATTSYFSPEFLKRKTWISTQDGDPLSVSATKIGPDMAKTVNGEIPATLWKISGDLDLDLLYAKDGKWLGSRFYAGGSQAEFLLQKSEGNMHSLWKV